jgi:hypothetical protein
VVTTFREGSAAVAGRKMKAVETATNETRTRARNDISILPATDMSGGTLVKSTHGCQRIFVNSRHDNLWRAEEGRLFFYFARF